MLKRLLKVILFPFLVVGFPLEFIVWAFIYIFTGKFDTDETLADKLINW